MDRLVKQLITPFITEQVKAKKVIAVYPGRFQPFGPHHKKVFQSLQKIKVKGCFFIGNIKCISGMQKLTLIF